MKTKKKIAWNEHIFNKLIHFVDKQWLLEKLKLANLTPDTDNHGKLQINHSYTLYKNMFGVMIETGYFEIRKILMKDALDLLNRFVSVHPQQKDVGFEAMQNVEGIIQTAESYSLETLNEEAVQGYVLNQELVFFEHLPFSSLIFKYKDNPENIFLLYRFYFSFLQDELFLIIEKSF